MAEKFNDTGNLEKWQVLVIERALSFLDQVRFTFYDQPHVYHKFLTILRDFKYKQFGAMDVIHHAADLLQGHPHLIVSFNKFLPPEKQLDPHSGKISEECRRNTVVQLAEMRDPFNRNSVRHAKSFVKDVKYAFRDKPEVYQAFTVIIDEFCHWGMNFKNSGTKKQMENIGHLFIEHPELILSFNTFLPCGYRIKMDHNNEVKVIMPGNETASDSNESINVRARAPSVTINLPFNLNGVEPPSLPGYSVNYVYSSDLELHQQLSLEDKRLYLEQVAFTCGGVVFRKFVHIITELGDQSSDVVNAIYHVLELFQEHLELVEQFNSFLPPGYGVKVDSYEPIQTNEATENTGTRFTLDSFDASFACRAP